MTGLYPFFIQYSVKSRKVSSGQKTVPLSLATVIVFADTENTARVRACRAISEKDLEITEFLRIHLLQDEHMPLLDRVLRKLLNQAELYGIALHCDLFPTGASCCGTRNILPD